MNYFRRIEGLRPDVEIVGWPMEAPTWFDARLVVEEVEPAWLRSLRARGRYPP